MILVAGEHPLSERFIDKDTYTSPRPPREIIRSINNTPAAFKDLAQVVKNGLTASDHEVGEGDRVPFNLYQAGRYSWVFLVQVGGEETGPIVQIARGDISTAQGKTVLKDTKNLTHLESIIGNHAPKVLGSGAAVIPGIGQAPMLVSEYLNGYHEIVNRTLTGFGNFLTNRREEESISFNDEQSERIAREMAKIVSLAYARTYDKGTNTGDLICDISIDSGDFVYRSFDDETRPLVKLITAREIEKATPVELITYLFSPLDYRLNNRPSVVLKYGYMGPPTAGGNNAVLSGVRDAPREVFNEEGDRVLEEWLDQFEQRAKERMSDVIDEIDNRRITYAHEIPGGLRSAIKLFCVRHHIAQEAQRTGTLRDPNQRDFDTALREAYCASEGLQRLMQYAITEVQKYRNR